MFEYYYQTPQSCEHYCGYNYNQCLRLNMLIQTKFGQNLVYCHILKWGQGAEERAQV